MATAASGSSHPSDSTGLSAEGHRPRGELPFGTARRLEATSCS
jgi:hypothetical protein